MNNLGRCLLLVMVLGSCSLAYTCAAEEDHNMKWLNELHTAIDKKDIDKAHLLFSQEILPIDMELRTDEIIWLVCDGDIDLEVIKKVAGKHYIRQCCR